MRTSTPIGDNKTGLAYLLRHPISRRLPAASLS